MQHCISDSIYRLTLAWISSETSTKQLECRLILTRSSFTGLDPLSSDSPLCSGVDCPCPCPVANSFELLFPTNSLLASPSTSGHGEISSPKPFVCFRAKTDKGIVCLAGHLHSVTLMNIYKHITNTYFKFNKKFYKQKYGLPMGNPLSGISACLFLEFLESGTFKYKLPSNTTYLRYIVDILFFYAKTSKLKRQQKKLNNFEPSINFPNGKKI